MPREPYKFYEMKCPYCDDVITELLEQSSDTRPFRCPSCKHILSLYGTFGYNMWLSANKKAKKCKERPISNEWINNLINKDKEQNLNSSDEEEMFIENDSEEEQFNEQFKNIEAISNKIKNILSSMGYKNIKIEPVNAEFSFKDLPKMDNEKPNSNETDNDKEFKEYINAITEQTQEIALVTLAQHNSFMRIGFTHEESMSLVNNLIKSNSLFPKLD